jgi:hypothetical protein
VLASLQRSGSSRIPATSADGYFRYIAESVVNADFTEAKRNRQDAKNKCCILLFIGIRCTGNRPKFLSCFKLCERGVIPVLVNTILGT